MFASIERDDNPLEAGLEIGDPLRQAEDRHHLACGRDDETVLPRHAVLRAAETRDDVPQLAVVHVEAPREQDAGRIQVERVAVEEVRIHDRRDQVVRGADRMDVTCEMEVDLFHRKDLGVTASCGPAFRPEHGSAGSRRRAKRFSLIKALLGWEGARASIFRSARLGRSSSRNSRTHHRGRLLRRREAVRECHWVRVVRLADRRHLCGRSLRRRGPDEVNPRRKRPIHFIKRAARIDLSPSTFPKSRRPSFSSTPMTRASSIGVRSRTGVTRSFRKRRTCFTSTHSSTRFFENSCLKSPAMMTFSACPRSSIFPSRSRITRRWNRGIETPCSARAPSKPRWRSEMTKARSLRRNSAKSRVASTPFATSMRSTAFRKTSNTDKDSLVAAWRGSLRTSSPHRFGSGNTQTIPPVMNTTPPMNARTLNIMEPFVPGTAEIPATRPKTKMMTPKIISGSPDDC